MRNLRSLSIPSAILALAAVLAAPPVAAQGVDTTTTWYPVRNVDNGANRGRAMYRLLAETGISDVQITVQDREPPDDYCARAQVFWVGKTAAASGSSPIVKGCDTVGTSQWVRPVGKAQAPLLNDLYGIRLVHWSGLDSESPQPRNYAPAAICPPWTVLGLLSTCPTQQSQPPPPAPPPTPTNPGTPPPREEDRRPPEPKPEARCDPLPAATDLRLRASLVSRRSATRAVTTSFGKRVRVRGRLTRVDGSPVAGADLCVASRTAVAGAHLRPAASVVTGPDGRFSLVLAPGPSRRVWFVHRSGGRSASASVTVRVRARVRLVPSDRSLRNGDTVRLRGSLAWRAARGTLVELQARRGRHWQTFATTRARRGGRFAYAYTFTRTFGVQHYRLRARAPAQRGFPFTSGASRPVVLRVIG
jgi:hypothetical protein